MGNQCLEKSCLPLAQVLPLLARLDERELIEATKIKFFPMGDGKQGYLHTDYLARQTTDCK